MHIVFLTQYFPPEVGAPQNRIFDLLKRLSGKGAQVTVLTAMPNYPKGEIYDGYKGKLFLKETMEGMTVYRSFIYASKRKGVVSRLLNYFSFVFSSFATGIIKLRKFDYIICESPPLFLGISAYLIKKTKGGKMIFNVSDLWPESAEKLGVVTNKTLLRAAEKLEAFLYKKSYLVTGQTQGIVQNISKRFPGVELYWWPNGTDPHFFKDNMINRSWKVKNGFAQDDVLFLYAGILGHAQGLEVILKAAKDLKNFPGIKFIIAGTGPEEEKLKKLKKDHQLLNVHFLGVLKKEDMISVIAASDAAIVPLRKLELFKGAIPSKIFENLAMQKPVLLGLEGEARQLFVEEGNCALPFEPENVGELKNAILKLYKDPVLRTRLGANGAKYVKEKFDRTKIANDFYNTLLKLDDSKKQSNKNSVLTS